MKRFVFITALISFFLAASLAAKERLIQVPAHCVEVYEFGKPCPPKAKAAGWTCNDVSVRIRKLDECKQYDTENFIFVPLRKAE